MTNNYCIVPTLDALYALQNHIEGECVYCEENSKIYTWEETNGWVELATEGQGFSMNLYDLNKSIVNQLTPLTGSEITAKMEIIYNLHNSTMNSHYMLLCKEYSYYTIFECDTMLNMPTFGAAVCETINGIGEVYSIEATEDNAAIEIWIKPDGEEDSMVFYLFPYDMGVIYYG